MPNRIGTFTTGFIIDDSDPSYVKTAVVMHCDRCGAQLINSWRHGRQIATNDASERAAIDHLATCSVPTVERCFDGPGRQDEHVLAI